MEREYLDVPLSPVSSSPGCPDKYRDHQADYKYENSKI